MRIDQSFLLERRKGLGGFPLRPTKFYSPKCERKLNGMKYKEDKKNLFEMTNFS
jgi:hypothetical protein